MNARHLVPGLYDFNFAFTAHKRMLLAAKQARNRLLASPCARLARLDKPVGTYLLMWPGFWSIALASPTAIPDVSLLAKFGVGALVMRSAGCTINDILDRKFDSQVARTRSRPLASGEISLPKALGFLAAQLSAGLGILLTLPEYAIYWGAASMIPVSLYPLSKRFLDYPQMVLGLTFNWGAILGWASVHSSIDWQVIAPLYVGCAAWTLGYDTIYAHQDKADDRKLGLKSSALTVGDENTQAFLTAVYAISVFNIYGAGLKYAALYGNFDTRIFSLGVAGMALNTAYQVYNIKVDQPDELGALFKMNHWVGPSLFFGITLAKIV